MLNRKEGAVARAAAGRYWRESQARTVVEDWERSGLPVSTFAELYGISAKRVVRWTKRLSVGAALEFHEVRVGGGVHELAGDRDSDRFAIELGDGLCVRLPRVFSAEDLRLVLDVVEGR